MRTEMLEVLMAAAEAVTSMLVGRLPRRKAHVIGEVLANLLAAKTKETGGLPADLCPLTANCESNTLAVEELWRLIAHYTLVSVKELHACLPLNWRLLIRPSLVTVASDGSGESIVYPTTVTRVPLLSLVIETNCELSEAWSAQWSALRNDEGKEWTPTHWFTLTWNAVDASTTASQFARCRFGSCRMRGPAGGEINDATGCDTTANHKSSRCLNDEKNDKLAKQKSRASLRQRRKDIQPLLQISPPQQYMPAVYAPLMQNMPSFVQPMAQQMMQPLVNAMYGRPPPAPPSLPYVKSPISVRLMPQFVNPYQRTEAPQPLNHSVADAPSLFLQYPQAPSSAHTMMNEQDRSSQITAVPSFQSMHTAIQPAPVTSYGPVHAPQTAYPNTFNYSEGMRYTQQRGV